MNDRTDRGRLVRRRGNDVKGRRRVGGAGHARESLDRHGDDDLRGRVRVGGVVDEVLAREPVAELHEERTEIRRRVRLDVASARLRGHVLESGCVIGGRAKPDREHPHVRLLQIAERRRCRRLAADVLTVGENDHRRGRRGPGVVDQAERLLERVVHLRAVLELRRLRERLVDVGGARRERSYGLDVAVERHDRDRFVRIGSRRERTGGSERRSARLPFHRQRLVDCEHDRRSGPGRALADDGDPGDGRAVLLDGHVRARQRLRLRQGEDVRLLRKGRPARLDEADPRRRFCSGRDPGQHGRRERDEPEPAHDGHFLLATLPASWRPAS